MASCTPTIAIPSITFDCDIPLGGLSRVYVGYLEGASGIAGGWKGLGIDVTGADGTYLITDADATGAASTDKMWVEIPFNTNDEVSNFIDEKTTNTNGTSETVPTIEIELALMSAERTQALREMTRGGLPLVAAIETAAGTYHIAGADFGLVGSVSGASGAQRSDKNAYTLTLTGRERDLAIAFDANGTNTPKANFDTIVAL
jgi:hypothetical protein